MKRAQVKMFETIAILVVFFILVMFGFIFYAKVQKGSLQEEQEEARILKAIEISQKVSFLPEIQCSRDNIQKENCIDLLKLRAASQIILLNNVAYFTLLGYSHIYVKEIYPGNQEWELYDFENTDNTGQISTQFPTSIYDPKTDTTSFGVLYVDVYR